jgi:dephospho-CoA kinase
MEKTPKLLFLGHKRHGKDTMAEILNQNFGLKYISSSQAAADIFIYNELKVKYSYKSPEECFEDRVNHRAEWYELICWYNKEDKAKLAKQILTNSQCYVGMRDREEITECIKQELFDLIIWVDASERLPLESPDSFNIDKSCADIIIDNNGTFDEFKTRVARVGKIIVTKNLIHSI